MKKLLDVFARWRQKSEKAEIIEWPFETEISKLRKKFHGFIAGETEIPNRRKDEFGVMADVFDYGDIFCTACGYVRKTKEPVFTKEAAAALFAKFLHLSSVPLEEIEAANLVGKSFSRQERPHRMKKIQDMGVCWIYKDYYIRFLDNKSEEPWEFGYFVREAYEADAAIGVTLELTIRRHIYLVLHIGEQMAIRPVRIYYEDRFEHEWHLENIKQYAGQATLEEVLEDWKKYSRAA